MNPWTARRWWNDEADADERYATQAWGGDGTPEQVEPTINKIIVNLDGVLFARNAKHIVELGCGPGRLLHRLAERRPDRQFYGYDISTEMLALGRWNRPSNVEVTVLWGDGSDFSPPKADMIYSVEVFQHLDITVKLGYIRAISAALTDGVAVVQYVVGKDEGEHMNHPETEPNMRAMFKHAGLTIRDDFNLNQVHDEWRWVVLSK